jgi:hypothetical protein
MRNFMAVPVEKRREEEMMPGDRRFLGVHGFVITVPGVPDSSSRVWFFYAIPELTHSVQESIRP